MTRLEAEAKRPHRPHPNGITGWAWTRQGDRDYPTENGIPGDVFDRLTGGALFRMPSQVIHRHYAKESEAMADLFAAVDAMNSAAT